MGVAGAVGRARETFEIAATAAGKRRVHGMLTREQVQSYRRDGYLLVENVLSASELATLRQVTDELVAASHAVTEHNHVYDLEPTHTPQAPRVRRIKEPHNVHPAFRDIAFSRKIADILTPLIGPSGLRFQTGKLNMKSAGYGAAVEWHQDWAFYPHTNDDLLGHRDLPRRLRAGQRAAHGDPGEPHRGRSSTTTAAACSAARSIPPPRASTSRRPSCSPAGRAA